MSHVPKVMHAFSRLLTYPDQHTAQAAELLYIVLQHAIPSAADDVSKFGTFLEQNAAHEIEEAFTGTFDVNPACALEVGWHLFGEEYARGMFLVRMREELRKFDLAESVELPDHISHVLAIVASMPDEDASKFVRACVQPAVEKMHEALRDKDTPYRYVISSLATVVRHNWGAGKLEPETAALDVRSPDVDPLHAYPVRDVGCGTDCGGGCGEKELFTLEPHLPRDGQSQSLTEKQS